MNALGICRRFCPREIRFSFHFPSRALDLLLQSFARLLHDGSVALVLLNRGATSTPLSVRWADVGLRPRAWTLCDVIDLFTGDRVTVGVGLFGLTVTVASHTAAAVRVSCPTV